MWTVCRSSTLLLSFACGALLVRVDAQGSVFPGEDTNLGPSVRQLASADIDGDSVPDFASVRQNSNVVTIVISNGTGGFKHTKFQTFSSLLSSVALSDLNSDGKIDLLVGTGGALEVRLGYGNGSFAPSHVFPNSQLTSGALIADLNGDAFLDVLGGQAGGQWTTSLGDGAGGFSATLLVPGTSARSVLGDLNNDGKLDLISVGAVSTQAGAFSIHLGDGAGSFAYAGSTLTWGVAADVTVGDWNSDGKLDLAIASGSQTGPLQNVTIVLGNGAGGVASQTELGGVGFQPFRITSGDVNSDGKRDVLVVTAAGQLTVLLGNGTGGFAYVGPFAAGGIPLDLHLGDIDNDGDLDLSMLRYGSGIDGRVANMLGDGTGTFVLHSSNYTPVSLPVGANAVSVALGDVNGDSIRDICMADQQSGRVAVVLAQGGGGFWSAWSFLVNGLPRRVALTDVDSDGTLDVVTANLTSNTASVHFGSGQGSFSAAIDTPMSIAPQDLAIGDLNGDAHPDLVVIDRAAASSAWIALGVGDGSFGPPTTRFVGQVSAAVELADLNLDGKLDLVVANELGDDVSVALGNGAGGFGPALFYVVPDFPRDLAIGDVSGDGKPDIVVLCGSLVSILLAGGPPGFGNYTVHETALEPRSIELADVDLDGKLDLLTGHSANRVTLSRGDGLGGFSPFVPYSTGNPGLDLALADMTGDGKIDAVSVGATRVSILVNQVQVTTPNSYCFGDGTSAPCPCGSPGAAGSGCPNSVLSAGGRLTASGVASVSNDSLTLSGTFLPTGPGLYFQGTGPLDAALNDGKVCAGGTLVRLGVAFANGNASQFPSASSTMTLAVLGAIPFSGGLRYYQLAYRDVAPGFCSSFTHNMTNGIALTWIP